MSENEIKIHPAANEFPMMDEKRLEELAEDIKKNGQREPIAIYKSQILDGRNRYKACRNLGIEPRLETLQDTIDPYAYVWSLNGERRDITSDPRYLIWKSLYEKSESWQAEQQRIREEANLKRAEAAKAQHEVSNPRAGETMVRQNSEEAVAPKTLVFPQSVGIPDVKPSDKNKTNQAKAVASKTNRGTVERMDRLVKVRPDLAEKVKSCEVKPADAIREMKRDLVVTKLEDIKTREVKAASGVYDVVVIDPPWQMQKIERDVRPNQTAFDYPTMSEEELSELDIKCAKDCHVWVWTTQKFLPMALRLLEAWGLKYVCTFVWHKPGGFQPIGLPQFNCEFCLYARKGTPQFIDTKAFPTCFEAPRGEHSEKPEAFYDVVRRVTAGRRLDMFNRREIADFDGWGNEAVAA